MKCGTRSLKPNIGVTVFYLNIALCYSPDISACTQNTVTLCHFKEKHFEEIRECLLQYIIIPGGTI